ncbi:MAG: hypothetical protein ACJAZP_002275 [Psychromonas sp.]|jgi:hypothetical protein|uniref:hypothetical protein n=1 Tax=Psychromonas sp. TaxID=1884585 RepID=UPI0039E652D3
MKKSFLATPKKLLLATSILAMSSTAMANTSTTLDNTVVSSDISVVAKYITPMTVKLDTSIINFGDVYTDSDVTVTNVSAYVTGELGETFTYSVVTTENGTAGLVVLTGETGGSGEEFDADASTAAELNFAVDLDTSKLIADTDVLETITVTVAYDAIADTTTTVDGDYAVPTPNEA